jgi:hypothetical protein
MVVCVDDDDGFYLFGDQSCIRQSSFTQTVALSVPSHIYISLHLPEQLCRICLIGASNDVSDPVVRRRISGVVT